jgi:adenylylsulfate kinase
MARRRGFTLWLTGLPCSGKSTLAEHTAKALRRRGHRVEVLDGDAVRSHVSRDLGYARADRELNMSIIAFAAQLLSRNGVAVLVAAVSPYANGRDRARLLIGDFVEAHVDCPAAECERRDVKGMYARARAGKIAAFTGVDDPYEVPSNPDVTVHTAAESIPESVQRLLLILQQRGYSAPGNARRAKRE